MRLTMYDRSDPRAALAASTPTKAAQSESFAAPEYGRFYDEPPGEDTAAGQSWFIRGQNFVLCYSQTAPNGEFSRATQEDEYIVVLPDRDSRVTVTAGGETQQISGFSIIMVPPGPSRVTVNSGGRMIRLLTSKASDLVARCSNAASYAEHRASIPPFQAWPDPVGGYRIRAYSLDVPTAPGRFGRIFRCTTFMVNYLDPQIGPRDITKLSPHHHDDFEQCSLAVEGAFMHHLRWPWTVNMNAWRPDEHQHFATPSALVIPPPSIHTTRGLESGANQLVDIFSPPRMDFSRQVGWVLNADDYPVPTQA
jgi:hypothetical protein